MKLKNKVKNIVKVQRKTGKMPKHLVKDEPKLQRAFQLMNRMDTGIEYSIEDMSYEEMTMVEYVNNWINEFQNQEMVKQQKGRM